MSCSDHISLYVKSASLVDASSLLASRLISYIDLTSLGDSDTEPMINSLCEKAITPYGPVAAVCIYPQFVKFAVTQLANTRVHIATVVNFPHGQDSSDKVVGDIKQAIAEGANEIDMVFPYSRFLSGDKNYATHLIQQCKAACGKKRLLKVILETGALESLEIIAEITRVAILAGADFVKTSTGKIPIGATLEAAATILLVMKALQPEVKHLLGFKVSGGVRELLQAAQYIYLANDIMGDNWVSSRIFRVGASQLLDKALATPMI